MVNPHQFWAFLSYSHSDAIVVDWIHEALETFRIPNALVGRKTSSGTIPNRIFPIFRDRSELSSSNDLNLNIEEALRNSNSLIVVCSPSAANAEWVNKEVNYFIDQFPNRLVVPVIVDGEPSNAFPKALLNTSKYAAARKKRIPLAVDLRPGKEPGSQALLRLISALLQLPFDEIRARDLERSDDKLLEMSQESLKRGDDPESAARLALKVVHSAADRRAQELYLRAQAALYQALTGLSHFGILRQGNPVSSVCFSPDKRIFVSGDDKGIVKIWNMDECKLIKELPAFNSSISRIVIDGSSKQIAIFSLGGTIGVLDTAFPARVMLSIDTGDPVIWGDFTTAASAIIFVTRSGSVHRRELDTGMETHHVLHGGKLNVAKMSGSREFIVTATHDSIKVWRTANLSFIGEFRGLSGILDVALSPDATKLAAASEDWSTGVWELAPKVGSFPFFGSILRHRQADQPKLLLAQEAPIIACSFGARSGRLVTFSRDNTAVVWNMETFAVENKLAGEGQGLALRAREVERWFGKIERNEEFSDEEKLRITEYIDQGGMAEFAKGSTPRHRRAFSKSFLELAGMEEWYRANSPICAGELSPDRSIVAKPSKDNSVTLFHTEIGRKHQVLRGHKGTVRALAFSPDGDFLATGDDTEVKIWRTGARSDFNVVFPERSAVLRFVLNFNSSMAMTLLADGGYTIWTMKTGFKGLHNETGPQIVCGAFSQNNELFVTGDDEGKLTVKSVTTSNILFEVQEVDVIPNSIAEVIRVIDTENHGNVNEKNWKFIDSVYKRIDQAIKSDWGEHYSPGIREVIFSKDDTKLMAYGSKNLFAYSYKEEGVAHHAQILSTEEHASAYMFWPRMDMFLVGLKSGRVDVWDSAKLSKLQSIEVGDEVVQLAASDRRKLIAIGSKNGTCTIWGFNEEKPLSFHGPDKITYISFDRKSDKVAVSYVDGSIIIWSTYSGVILSKLEHEINESKASATSANFSADGLTIITSDSEQIARVWSVETGERLATSTQETGEFFTMIEDGTVVGICPSGLRLLKHLPGAKSLIDVASTSLNGWSQSCGDNAI